MTGLLLWRSDEAWARMISPASGTIAMPRLFTLLALLLFPALALAQTPAQMSPREAHAHVAAGKAVLVDIRTPQEWRETGSPQGAVRLDMTAPDFVTKLEALRRAEPGKDIALICRTGNRSGLVQRELAARGWTNLVDVRGGVAGRPPERGWKADGLPMVP